jgi:hypothetical protein
MKKALAVLAAVAVSLGVLAAPASANLTRAKALPLVLVCSGSPSYKPSLLHWCTSECSSYLTRLFWKSWTPTTAIGTGTLMTNDGTPNCAQGTWTAHRGYTVTLSKPRNVSYCGETGAASGLLFTSISLFSATIPVFRPPCDYVAPPRTTPPPPNVIGGQWEYVGFLGSGEAIDVVRLTLVNFPPGHLTGSWSETAAPRYQPGLALNGTECAGCNGVVGAYHDEFGVVGSVQGGTFTIEVQNDGDSNFSGALGNATPYGAIRYGCGPIATTAEMFLVSGSSAYLFFRPQGFPGVAVGRQVSC